MTDLPTRLREHAPHVEDWEDGDGNAVPFAADLRKAAAEIERLSEILTGIEMLTATGEGLDAEQTISIHLIAAEGRSDDPHAWRADPAVIERLRAAVRGEAARDAEIERLTALLQSSSEMLHEAAVEFDAIHTGAGIADAIRNQIARIKEPRNALD